MYNLPLHTLPYEAQVHFLAPQPVHKDASVWTTTVDYVPFDSFQSDYSASRLQLCPSFCQYLHRQS